MARAESAGQLGSASPWGAPSPGVVQAAVWAESTGQLGSASPWSAPSPGAVQAAVWARAESAGQLGSAILQNAEFVQSVLRRRYRSALLG